MRAGIEQITGFRHERRNFSRTQPQAAYWRGDVYLFEPATREFEQRRGFTFGCQQADDDFTVGFALVFEPQAETLHAAVAATQERREIRSQATQRKQECLAGFDVVLE